MNIDIKDTIKLSDNNEYLVISKTVYEEDLYFYLIDINNNEESKILKLNKDNNKLANVTDETLIQKLILLFSKEASKYVEDESN
jgi:hypothetical protein